MGVLIHPGGDMLGALFVTLIVGGALAFGLFLLVGIVFRTVLKLLLLPLRLVGWLLRLALVLPLRLLRGGLRLVGGGLRLLATPVVIAAGVIAALAVALPLLPVLAVALVVWLLVRVSSRPAAV
jgi:hypothetical protein